MLAAAGLPTADLTVASLADCWGCGAEEKLAGVIGLETYGSVALLRSLTVAPIWPGWGLGTALLAHAERAARQRSVQALYLLTAAAFFAWRGYTRILRQAAPPVFHRSAAPVRASEVCPGPGDGKSRKRR